MSQRKKWALGTAVFILLLAIGWFLFFPEQGTVARVKSRNLKTKIISVRPHDPKAFTQGLIYHDGTLYESTGLKGRSSLRQVDPHTGQVLRKYDLAPDLFAEGLARAGDRLIQLTWKNRIAFLYDLRTLAPIGEFQYPGEGWGLCFDGKYLIMSDGTSILTFRDTKTFEPSKRISVTLSGKPVDRLNELEYAEGSVYANVWGTDMIVQIDPVSGQVLSLMKVEGLLSKEESLKADVLNGICYDPENRTFLLTGKYWPKMFEVIFVP